MLSDSLIEKVTKVFEEKGLKNIKFKLEAGSKAGDGYAGVMTRAEIVGEKNGEEQIYDVMVKTTPSNPECRKWVPITAAFNREILFYETIAPIYKKIEEDSNIPTENRLNLPECYGFSNEYGSEFIILSNLKVLGYSMMNRCNMNYEHLSKISKKLGQFHALSFVFQQRYPTEFDNITQKITDVRFKNTEDFDCSGLLYFVDRCYDKFLENIKNQNYLARVKHAIGKSLSEKIVFLTNRGNNKIIIHGDFWTNNMLFKYKDDEIKDIIPLDFQAVYYASMANDILNLYGVASDKDLRKYFWTIIDEYYSSISKHLSLFSYDADLFCTKEKFKQEIKEQILFFLVTKITTVIYLTLNQIFDASEILSKRIPDSFNVITDEYVKSVMI